MWLAQVSRSSHGAAQQRSPDVVIEFTAPEQAHRFDEADDLLAGCRVPIPRIVSPHAPGAQVADAREPNRANNLTRAGHRAQTGDDGAMRPAKGPPIPAAQGHVGSSHPDAPHDRHQKGNGEQDEEVAQVDLDTPTKAGVLSSST